MEPWQHDTIAERSLSFRAADGTITEVTIRIARPVPAPQAAADFICYWQALGFRDSPTKYASGVDAVQALELAFEMIGINLEAWQRDYNGTFLFYGESPHGFPARYWDRAVANQNPSPEAHPDASP
jgi:hypothetical protein